MTLFLNYPIDLKDEKIILSEWSNTEIPILAVVTDNKKIIFYYDEALKFEDNILTKQTQITSISWHPNTMVLSYGFDNGRLGIWIDNDNFSKDDYQFHDCQITHLQFNLTGNRLISVDEKNQINIFYFDGSLSKLCSYTSKFIIDKVIFPCFNPEYYRSKGNILPFSNEKFESLFIYSTQAGIVYLADDSEISNEICRVGGRIKGLLFYEDDNSIIILTDNANLVKSNIIFSGNLTQKRTKLTLPGRPETIQSTWAGNGLLALINQDDIIRLYNIETDRSYFISIADHYKGNQFEDEKIIKIEFCKEKRLLYAGTLSNKIYIWKCNMTSKSKNTSSESWEPYNIVNISQTSQLSDIKCSKYMGLTYIKSLTSTSLLSETILKKKVNSFMRIIQISNKSIEITINKQELSVSYTKRMDIKESIKEIESYKNKFCIWNGSQILIYEVLDKMVVSSIGSFKLKSKIFSLNEDSVIVGTNSNIDIYNFKGEKKGEVTIEPLYGYIKGFNTNSNFILVITNENYIGVYDSSRRVIKNTFPMRKLSKDLNQALIGDIKEGIIDNLGVKSIIISEIKVSSEQKIPDSSFYIYSFLTEQVDSYEISSNRVPVEGLFDENDNRVFGIKTEYAAIDDSLNEIITVNEKEDFAGSEFYMFFHSSDIGIKYQEKHVLSNNNIDIKGIVTINLPNIFFKTDSSIEPSLLIKKFQFFAGMGEVSFEIKNTIIEFSILIASGKIDEAYKSVQNIKSQKIWENIAVACIKSKRLDVLEICLSNMRFAIGIKAYRENQYEKEVEVSLAMVAMHLNMIEEAKNLLEEVKRYDLLVRFYIAIGEYSKAIDTSKEKNRINLENTYYRIAQHYERKNNIDKAMEYYKLSNCGNREIPRMLISKGRIDLLEKFMSVGTDKNSLYWWASYLEANGEIEKALDCYRKANDWTNIVRVLLAQDKLSEAKQITDETKDQGACYLLGKYYENIGDIKNAIYYYALSGRINQAFRLAKEHNMDNEIYNLGLKANPNTQNLIAEYFEERGQWEKAINLYIMSKNIKSALNLCFDNQQYDKLNEIAEMVEFQSDPNALRKLAEYFLEKKQYERALRIFIKLKDWERCLYICENFKIKISIESANLMLNELDVLSNSADKERLTLRLAELLKQQGEFELAHDIYIKYGDLVRAMKCLIKLGNKDKVIKFANTCRNDELYILAANYLQSLDWNEEIVKSIVSFYSKSKAWMSLSNFYELFASVEITEYRNYIKALELYDEALKVIINKLPDEEVDLKKRKEEEIENKIKITKIYKNALEQSKDFPDKALALCNQMLNLAGVDNVVKEIDIYTLMLEIYLSNKDYPAAYSVLEVLRTMGKKIDKYVDHNLIEVILKSVNKLDKMDEYISNTSNYNGEVGEIKEELY